MIIPRFLHRRPAGVMMAACFCSRLHRSVTSVSEGNPRRDHKDRIEKIAAVQIRPFPGDVQANIQRHLELIELALSLDSDLIIFPELSVTGYEPSLAANLASSSPPGSSRDTRLDAFAEVSAEHQVVVCVGMPLWRCEEEEDVEEQAEEKDEDGDGGGKTQKILSPLPEIGMVIFRPDGARLSYSKQHLHEDELPYFRPAATREPFLLSLSLSPSTSPAAACAPGICYETLLASHAEAAHAAGASVYLASVAKPLRGIEKAVEHYPSIAARWLMPVILSNSVGACDDFVSVGGSGAWDARGRLLAQMDDRSEGVVVFDVVTQQARVRYI